jgi:GTP:adenosylcobinamide-phosphate guanylyltransferase
MNVVMMAGGGPKHPFSEDIIYKSLVPIAGKPMVKWVAEAFLGCNAVEKIFVVGPKEELTKALEGMDRIVIFEGSERMLDNIESGMKYFEQDKQLIIATADIPMINTEMVEWLVENFSKNSDKQFIYPIIHREDVEKRFPGMRRTYVKLKDGEFTGGNICCVEPSAALKKYDLINKLVEFRKAPVKTAAMLGFKIVFGMLTGKLKIKDVEKRAKKISGLEVYAMRCPYAEVGSDVDRESDLPSVTEKLSK